MIVPAGYQAVMPYLILKNAEGFIDFTHKVFNASVKQKHLREDHITIMHGEIDISGCVIMFAESTSEYPVQTANLFVYVENADQTYKTALINGAASVNEPADQPYGRSCGIDDPQGNRWWITSLR